MIIAYFVNNTGKLLTCEMDSDMYKHLMGNDKYRFIGTRKL